MIDIINNPKVKKHITVKVYEEIIITASTWTSNNIAWRNGIPYEVSYV